LSLSGALTRGRALEQLLGAGSASAPDTELCINAVSVDAVDVVAATATRMCIARHLRQHPRGSIVIWPPRHVPVAARLADLLSPLPERVVLAGGPSASAPAHYALTPASVIDDSEAANLVGEYVLRASREARIGRRRAGYIAQAAMELADNAVIHAAGAADLPVLAVTSVGRERIVEVAVTDAGTTVSEADDPVALVRAIPGRALGGDPGFLGQIVRRGRQAGVDVTVEVLAGTARLVWTATSHRTVQRRHVAGMTVVARIGA
jgi:anti-sigma regulatory factor (Ser/Thr protein kinase)